MATASISAGATASRSFNLDLTDVILVGHSTGGGVIAWYVGAAVAEACGALRSQASQPAHQFVEAVGRLPNGG